jgi:hypothetical protein
MVGDNWAGGSFENSVSDIAEPVFDRFAEHGISVVQTWPRRPEPLDAGTDADPSARLEKYGFSSISRRCCFGAQKR